MLKWFRQTTTKTSPRRPPCARPAVELLEDRQLLSITPAYLFSQHPQSLGGTALRQVSETIDGAGRQVIVALGGDHAVYEKTETAPGSFTFSGWQFLGGNVQSVKVASDFTGAARVFSLGWDGCVYTIAQQLGGDPSQLPNWESRWSDLGGNNVQQFDVGNDRSNDGYLVVYTVGANHQLSINGQVATGPSTFSWSGWHNVGGSVLCAAASSYADVFVLGTDHSVYEGYGNWTGGGWQWKPLGGHDIQQIAVGVFYSEYEMVFAVGGDQALYCNQRDGLTQPTWSGWAYLGGSVRSISVPERVFSNQVFALGTDGHAYDVRLPYHGLSGTWHPLWGQWSSIVAGSAYGPHNVFLGISLSDSSVYEQLV
jgi:hypothetical protein